jgi:GNAT superfamily N-acetyltransferase
MQTVYARSTDVDFVELEDALTFCEEHHSQGIAALGKDPRAVALSYNGSIVAVAIFCNPRTSLKQRDYTTELFRMAFHRDYRVTGGGSKLIQFFIRKARPADIFTYQTTSGENTDVYKHAGMELIETNETKKILVKNGLTHETAKNNRVDWFSVGEVVRYGPDALLKTKLGEVLGSDGKRLSNVDLFIQECGYHIEVIAGDKVYEWRNPDVSYYCYKITSSTRDSKYYIGRKRINKATPTFKECLEDGYYGSGGLKYKNWVKLVGEDKLEKEILGVYRTYKEALKAESSLIGDSYQTDPNCLNSIAGGRFSPVLRNRPKIETLVCSIHGETTHQGGVCSTCTSNRALNYRDCPTHGFVKHQGDVCSSCNSQRSVSERECAIHGVTTHQGTICMKCNSQAQFSTKTCTVHGEALFKGDACTLCTAQKAVTERECATHGLTKHQGNVCSRCNAESSVSMKECPTHGLTKHQGAVCNRCNAQRSVSLQECPIHGEAKFQGGKCVKCRNAALITVKECPVHGAWKHRGSSCYACVSDRKKAKKAAATA